MASWCIKWAEYIESNTEPKQFDICGMGGSLIFGAIAQLVEQGTENSRVPSAILGGTTRNYTDTLTSRDTKRKLKDETELERYVPCILMYL